MAFDLSKPLVIGISSRALFNLELENDIFEKEGVTAYEDYQIAHEKDILSKGSAFQLVKAFLELNKRSEERLVEVIIMSQNNPNASLRIFNSIEHYGLDITRAALTSGAEITPYLQAFKADLFLSANASDVQLAINKGVAAGQILTGPSNANESEKVEQIRIAFDGDAVLFAAEAERVFQKQGMAAFDAHEQTLKNQPLEKGPFANFLMAVSNLQKLFQDSEKLPIRTALVTSRSAPAHERAIKTLRAWNIRIDEAFFLGGASKKDVLAAFGAHIFFDDSIAHAGSASEVVPSALVPYRDGDNPKE